MPPHRNHVEARASGPTPTQYVSDTHDHKPDVIEKDGPELYTGLALEMDEIALGMNVLNRHARNLRECFDAKQTVSLALAAADIAKVSNQISVLSAHMAKMAGANINRRSRA